MEFFKKNKFLTVSGAIALVLLVVAGVFLFLYIRQYNADTSEVDAKQTELTRLETRQPAGPTAENVQMVASNAVATEGSLKKLLAELRRGQIEPVNKPRSVFNSFLKSNIDQMNEAAKKQSLLLPAKFDYGFKTYVEGLLPATQDVARLTVQVQMVRALMDAVLQAKAKEIVSVERQFFEENAVAGPGSGRVRQEAPTPGTSTSGAIVYPLEPPDAQGLYTREHFTLNMRISDEYLAALLNILAHNVGSGGQRLFTVVSRVNIIGVGLPKTGGAAETEAGGRSEGTAAAPGTPAPVAAVTPAAETGAVPGEKPALPKKREERIVAGTDPVTVALDVDVYRFAAAEPKEKVKP
ncbi:MAG: Amuc_1100 family pilus-like protein [Kiritimatiellaeota bacterium]|nr:Amuc_1100 family pilus-like protein [Kiritimatiellota bacterium]